MRLFLISTDHLEDRIWFRDDDDLKAAMNIVAIIVSMLNIDIWVFALMSNHVHFIIFGNRSDAELFITKFKKLYGQYYQNKYRTKHFLKRNGVDISEVDSKWEGLEKAMAYVQMNPPAANICLDAQGYKWGTGSCFFNGNNPSGKKASEFSYRELCRLLKTHARIRPDMVISDEGYVLPESYVNIAQVETVFGTPKRMNYFLNSSSKARARIEKGGQSVPSFSDKNIAALIPDICVSLFRTSNMMDLGEEELARLSYELRRRFSCDIAQIARLVGMTKADLAKALDKF